MTATKELIDWLDIESKLAKKDDSPVASAYLRDAAQRLRELSKPDCVWTFDADQGMYDAGCGEAWCFEEGGTAENKVKFCPFCQGAVREAT